MKNKEGFTLTELLVVIVILAIITGLSIPLIRNIQANNADRQYKAYLENVKYSAKLYVNSYQEDLFGHNKSGCAIVRYSELEEKGLLKDIPDDKISCASDEDTYIKIIKVDDKITYVASIGCGEKNPDGTVNVKIKYPKDSVEELDNCEMGSSTVITFATDPSYPNLDPSKRRNINVLMNSQTGFHEDIQIFYGFVKRENKLTNEMEDPTSTLIDGWKKLDVQYVGGNEQKRIIETGRVVTLNSDGVVTPENQTGDVYLVLRIESLKDIAGRLWTTDTSLGKYMYFGTYRLDNTPPICSLKATVEGVTFNTKIDNYGVASFGINKTGSAVYDSTEQLTLDSSDFYGYVKDAAGNVGDCSIKVEATQATKWTKQSKACAYTHTTVSGSYSSKANCTTATCSKTGCSCTYGSCMCGRNGVNVHSGSCSKSGCKCSSGYYPITNTCIPTPSGQYTVSKTCTTSTCSKSGCSCVYHYSFGTETTLMDQTSCTQNIITCNASNNGKTNVVCTPTEYSCVDGSYTKINDDYCYYLP